MHVLDLKIGQVAILDGLAQHHAGVSRMHMAVGHIVILDHNNRVAVGFQKSAQAGDACSGILMDQELGAVAVFDILNLHQVVGKHALACCAGIQLRLGGNLGTGNDLAAVKHLLHALKHQHDALAAGIHNASLFQHRQQVGGVLQSFLASFAHGGPQLRHIVGFSGNGSLGSQAGNGQDGALGGLHDRLVSSFHAHLQGFGQVSGLGIGFTGQRLGKTAEQQAGDNAGVAARTAQHGGSSALAGFGHRAGIRHGVQLAQGRADRHAHIGTCITIRHRENVQLVHAGTLICNIVGAGNDGVAQCLTSNHSNSCTSL